METSSMERSQVRETVLITGVGGSAGRAAATYFAGRGYRVLGTDMRDADSSATAFRLIPPAREGAFVAALLEIATKEKVGLLVPTVSEELPIVARMRGALRERGISLSLSGAPGVDIANDKLRTAEELGKAGVSVPITFPQATPRADLIAALGWPVLSKPRVGRGGRGVRVHASPADLVRTETEEVVFQEFLPGEEYDLNLFVERDGRVPAAVVLRKTGLKEGLVGNALGTERAERPDIAALGIEAARALHLEGPLDMDIRLRANGTPAVLEINARLGANVLSAREVLDAFHDAWRNDRCA